MSLHARDLGYIRAALLSWYRANRRDLPWRRTRAAYAVWISEAMLQQTRVETVIPYYERFLQRFPDVASLAAANLEDVYAAWAGLGYYSRARNLHRAAVMVMERFGGQLPASLEDLLCLPGIGRYTAGAVASIAFGRPVPILDGNVERVLARYLGLREDVKSPAGTNTLWAIAGRLADGPSPGELNQALMELGATVCRPRSPRCPVCPLLGGCRAHHDGDAESLPIKPVRPKPRAAQAVAALVQRGARVLAVRRPPGGLLGGLWELPGGTLAPDEAPEDGLERTVRERVGLELEQIEPAGSVEHVFTHRRLRLHLFRCQARAGRVRLCGLDAHRWLAPKAVARLAHGALTRKALAQVFESHPSPPGQRRRTAARPAEATP